ncbi:MAG TPA: three-Cys-motif partner protein TcmP [Acetobacteraceae bacterium]|nr:three-Cys-motif partner protein TcmP [Acetobacteraceae bacterium]
MPDPRTAASWAIQPHTEAKHFILATYLRAWFPILSLGGFERVIYIDGFAGPGRYSGGQDGSPIIALKSLAAQTLRLRSTFEFHFVERNRRAAVALSANIDDLRAEGAIGPTAEVHIHPRRTFDDAYDRILGPRLRAYPRAPAFAFVDPFGWTGIPMRILSDLLRRPNSEVLVNFMFEEINRFLAHPDQPRNFDALFGSADWRCAHQADARHRRRFIHDLYRSQLQLAARHVRSFEMRNLRGAVDYYLFFATNSLKGLVKMKEAMWRVDSSSGLMFSDATDFDQSVLFAPEPDRTVLRRLLEQQFAGHSVRVAEVEHFVIAQTPFLPTHYKRVLGQMEASGRVSPVGASPRRRPGTYADANLILMFS